jgi:low affinity Fe/Cu permease
MGIGIPISQSNSPLPRPIVCPPSECGRITGSEPFRFRAQVHRTQRNFLKVGMFDRRVSYAVSISMKDTFSKFAAWCAHIAGHPMAFVISTLLIVVWAVLGPIYHYSDTWQLVANTATSIITFLMVFVIQNSQNRDGAAIQAKLDELIRSGSAENRFVGIDLLTEDEVGKLRERIAARAKRDTRAEGVTGQDA